MTQKTQRVQVLARVLPDLKEQAEKEAKDQNRSLSNLIEVAIMEYLAKGKGK